MPMTRAKNVGTDVEIVTMSWRSLFGSWLEAIVGAAARDVAVLLRLGQGGRLGVRPADGRIEVVGQPDDAGQGRGVGGALDPQACWPSTRTRR